MEGAHLRERRIVGGLEELGGGEAVGEDGCVGRDGVEGGPVRGKAVGERGGERDLGLDLGFDLLQLLLDREVAVAEACGGGEA